MQESLEDALVSWMERYEALNAAAMATTPDWTWPTQKGVTDLESQELLEPDMVWPLRSVTKSVVVIRSHVD
ncbi:beta-lactamase family protein [Enteractinococcus coprophilus]|uniref:Uncharacterized protein n=1 Tax=Enteractinococcus coprophilus TaxID=1027633 RepID=A0A543AGG4_9MICC|nr:beta-lactamase family protein [Enteractinococcus coprophilus]TQL71662.1 hypothetical protein FB556_2152 [Enteractinococcus coprophilus]